MQWITGTLLVAVVATGVSISLTNNKVPALSWTGLIWNGFEHAVKIGKITAAQVKNWQPQLASNDLDELLGAAEFMGRRLDAPNGDLYAHWLKGLFEGAGPKNKKLEKAIQSLHVTGIPLCTLNYDTLLEILKRGEQPPEAVAD